jgi:hypothetical protein
MRIERRPLAGVAAADWDRLAGGSFFASRGFVELWRHAGGAPVAWIAVDAGRIAAMLPGVEYGAGPLVRFASLPDGCYGGVCPDPALEDGHRRFSAGLLDAIARRGYAKACVFDFAGGVAPHAAFDEQREETRLADIRVPDWQPNDAKLRSQIRKAAREGIRVVTFDWEKHHDGFLALVAATARRHGQRPRHPAALYAALARLATSDARVRWRYCERDGRPVASHIYFVERDTVLAWQSHFDRAFSFLKPNQYIRFAVCREAARDGVRWLNLGSTPVSAAGLAYYKARWGGSRVRYSSWYRWQGLGTLARSWLARARDRLSPAPTLPSASAVSPSAEH